MDMIESINSFSMDRFSLKGKVAMVTGANQNLGMGFSKQMQPIPSCSAWAAAKSSVRKARWNSSSPMSYFCGWSRSQVSSSSNSLLSLPI